MTDGTIVILAAGQGPRMRSALPMPHDGLAIRSGLQAPGRRNPADPALPPSGM